jgi:hypothetical protein
MNMAESDGRTRTIPRKSTSFSAEEVCHECARVRRSGSDGSWEGWLEVRVLFIVRRCVMSVPESDGRARIVPGTLWWKGLCRWPM